MYVCYSVHAFALVLKGDMITYLLDVHPILAVVRCPILFFPSIFFLFFCVWMFYLGSVCLTLLFSILFIWCQHSGLIRIYIQWQGSAHTGPALTPAEVLIAIHDIDPEKDGVALKKVF